jgi:ribosomal protein S12 methylthiotransferase
VAYLKIAEGCNRACSFCTIPQIRGPYRSKPIEQLVAEAEQLAATGTRELVVVAQDTSYYGLDLYGKPRLAELLDRLESIEGLAWIRLMYLYPLHITDELLERLAGGGKTLAYLDLPLQHISDEILARMRRGVTQAQTERLLERLRQRVPGLVLRTTLLVGFPGETERHFQELVDFVRRQRFERLGVFCYSQEPGTTAAALDEQVPPEVSQKRRAQLMEVQQRIAFAYNEAQVGRRLEAIIDAVVPGEKRHYVGRSRADAPEIDGVIYVTADHISPGDLVRCEVAAARGYDLIGFVPAHGVLVPKSATTGP